MTANTSTRTPSSMNKPPNFTLEQERAWQIWSNEVQALCREGGMGIVEIFKAFQACTNARTFFANGGSAADCAKQFLQRHSA